VLAIDHPGLSVLMPEIQTLGAFIRLNMLPVMKKSTAALIRHLMPKDGVFYDICANWGFFSLLVAVDKAFSGTVHAFEPVPETLRDLKLWLNKPNRKIASTVISWACQITMAHRA
jgi:hypothetical protein